MTSKRQVVNLSAVTHQHEKITWKERDSVKDSYRKFGSVFLQNE